MLYVILTMFALTKKSVAFVLVSTVYAAHVMLFDVLTMFIAVACSRCSEEGGILREIKLCVITREWIVDEGETHPK